MCGRFALATPVTELAAEMDTEPLSDLTPFKPSWNVAPQRFIPVATEAVSYTHLTLPTSNGV